LPDERKHKRVAGWGNSRGGDRQHVIRLQCRM
jgi:hypothetical protein